MIGDQSRTRTSQGQCAGGHCTAESGETLRACRLWPQTIRALGYLKLGKGTEAAAEYQKILDYRGQSPPSVLYPLAALGSAQAAARQNHVANSRQAYETFFALWKEADADLPLLIEAKKEYEKLK
jgi:eukaryotic-like serine/threonine-protein kinase